MSTAPVHFSSADEGLELQRAEVYGLLARLWLAAPDAELRRQFDVAVTEAPQAGAYLEEPWRALVGAMRSTPVRAAADEFAALFHGTGKPEILPYASHHLAGALNDAPLVALRSDLAALGLVRDTAVGDTEDHIAFIFEVMRYLIAGDDIAVCNLEQQRRFFRAHVQPWVGSLLCPQLQAHPVARLYAHLAAFTGAFIEVETQGFDMVE